MSLKDFQGVQELVADPLSAWLDGGPQLQVLKPVVEAVSVSMMNVLVRVQRPAQMSRHDDAVFGVVRAATTEMALGRVDTEVSVALGDPISGLPLTP